MILPVPDQKVAIVTGPQRSGTTIAARILAADWGRQYIPEETFAAHDEDAFYHTVYSCHTGARPAVIQAPGMAHVLEYVATPRVLVVWILRPLDEILASQARIDWTRLWAPRERAKYPGWPRHWPVALIKYRRWRQVREHVPHWVQLPYRRLEGHPLWVPAEERRTFGPRQTARTKPLEVS
ncbi:MAG: hypothetical protein ACOC9X_01340 [bacterium]